MGDHADVDAVFTQLGEDAAGGAGLIGHFPAYGGHDGHIVRHMDAVGLQLLLQITQHGIQARGHLLGRHHQRYRVDAGGQVVHVDAVALQHLQDLPQDTGL